MLEKVQSLWVGSISQMERLCMRSFLRQGHAYHLYTYGDLLGVPKGVVMEDANEIVPEGKIEQFQNLANFSDFFRFTVLFKKGGWWADTDVCCLKPFEFDTPYVFATQLVSQRTKDEVTSCVIKAPQGSEMMQWCLDRIADTNTKTNSWSAIGPALLLEGHKKFGLQNFVQRHETFCPVHYFEAPGNVLGPESGKMRFGGHTFAVHLWNEEMRRAGVKKHDFFLGSLYDRLDKEIQ